MKTKLSWEEIAVRERERQARKKTFKAVKYYTVRLSEAQLYAVHEALTIAAQDSGQSATAERYEAISESISNQQRKQK